jgi:AcrR family transcriptional regulator
MDNFIHRIEIKVNEAVFLKDPNSSELGKNIISESIRLLDEIGLESFTFKKLSKDLNTAESSIYRYFESKHFLLLYLISWYWTLLEWQLMLNTANIPSAKEKLKLALSVISQNKSINQYEHINLVSLNQVVIAESSKAYLTKEVDEVNKKGCYAAYKRFVARVSDIVLEVNPSYKYAHTLISTIVEGMHHQKYFAIHLPSLTDIKKNVQELEKFYLQMALAAIEAK